MTARQCSAALVVVALAGGCGEGSGEPGTSSLRWDGAPRLLEPPTTESDRILQGVLRNDSSSAIELEADAVELRDARGRRVDGTAVFLTGYVRPGESQNRGPAELSRQESERLGKRVRIAPGGQVPVVVSWRTRDGRPVAIRYPGGSLRVPGG